MQGINRKDVLVIGGASVGTLFEWYDFYLYGSLAAYITHHFFSGVNETTGYIFALLAFAAGFAVRPFGALIFGRLGDLWGRKNTFLVTMLLMGLSTFAVGLLPSYSRIGVLAPVILISLRLVQGLALGGEYGGAAVYVAEHAPEGQRGYYTSWIQTTATVGLFLSLVVILAAQLNLSSEAFSDWGWRIPFLFSAVLLAVSMWIRLKLDESPVFKKLVSEGKTSRQPLTDAFTHGGNIKLVLVALFGITVGEAVIWYTGQFYALFFLEQVLKVDPTLTNEMVAAALVIGTPFLVVFGWLSDKIGRKPVVMAGCALAVLTVIPLFHALTTAANPDLAAASARAPVTVVADPARCSFQFDPIGKTVFNSSCDIAKSYLAKAGIPYSNAAAPAGSVALIRVGSVSVPSFEGGGLPKDAFAARQADWTQTISTVTKKAGYPARANSAKVNVVLVVAIIALLMVYIGMLYGPMAALLVEMFPAHIRYTSLSLPYHIGNGWFGGFLPTVAFAVVAATGNIYYGLWYPVGFAALTLVVGMLFLKDQRNIDIAK